jgi:hypothetical protein
MWASHVPIFAPYFVPGPVARSSALIPRICARTPARLYVFAGPDPMLEITVAVAPGPARASCPTVHAASCPTRYRCLSAGVTGSSPRSAPPGFGQIREPPFYVGLTQCPLIQGKRPLLLRRGKFGF